MSKELKVFIGVLAVFIVFMNMSFAPSSILSWDVFGYYLYLPLTFIYHDLGLQNEQVVYDIIEKYDNTATFYQALNMPNGQWVMKYSMGMSVLYAPFFFIGWVFSKVLDYPTDGFSAPFQYAIFVGGIVYSLIGVWFTAKVLNRFFTPIVTIISLALIVFATNYLVHITMYGQNAMSQNYLFTGYALVLWLTIRWHDTHKLRYMITLGVISGLMVLSRPTEIVVLIIPVLYGVSSKKTFFEKINLLWKYKKQIIVFALIIGCLGSFQLIYWKIYTGKFLFNSYGGNPSEGLEFLSPYTKEFLFSFRKGWLVYTPVMALAIGGFYFMYQKNRAIFFALIAYFVMNLWFVSSWSNWWYAQSFSQRAMVSSYPIMAIYLGFFLTWLMEQKKAVKRLGLLIVLIIAGFNIFQTTQWYYGVIHSDRMTKDYYFAVFGKLSVTDEDKKKLLVERSFDGFELFRNEEEYSGKVFKVLNFDEVSTFSDSTSHSGCCSYLLTTDSIYSPFIEGEFQELTKNDHAWVRVSAFVFPTEKDIESDAFGLAISFLYNGYAYKYKSLTALNANLIPNQWNKMEFDYLTPEVRTKSDKFRVLVFYNGHSKLLVDDLKVEVFNKK